MSEFDKLHPALQYHVVNSLGWSSLRPTQLQAIEPILSGVHCLLLAPTAGGKTEAAIIPVLSRMLTHAWPGVSVIYVCPIKALLNNLEQRLSHYARLVGRRVAVWHGDVSQSKKGHALKDAPDILLTTPESLEGMLVSTRIDRKVWFGNLRVVIADELHAFAADDRGWHMRAVLHRLQQYVPQEMQRLGLSATVSNPAELLDWFAPTGIKQVVGSASVSTDADVTVDFVGSLANAATVIARLHRGSKRLVFSDSRSSAEQLTSMLRAQEVRTFLSHASLSHSERKLAETAFAEEKDCVIVATSTLELGIDVGDLDHVIQIDAPATVSSFLQRMGRTGRREGARRSCLFLCTNDDSLMLAIGICRLWGEAWVEAAYPPPEPWALVAQQAMVATLERAQWPRRELIALLCGAFPESSRPGITDVIDHMVASSYLMDTHGVLQIGPATEKQFGRAHYKDLLASFSGTQLLLGRCGSAEVGYIDPTMLAGDKPVRLILLAGKSWRITEIDWKRQTVWLEPAKEGGTARWNGSGRTLSREIAQGILRALRQGAGEHTVISKRARLEIEQVTQDLPETGNDGALSVTRNEAGAARLWTFAGTRANRTLARQIQSLAESRRIDAMGIDLKTPVDLSDLSAELLSTALAFSPEEVKELAKPIKFSECLPATLLLQIIRKRQFGL
ncbi:DEAD/DEAH box helicase [Polaromonas naphthalenivorans]|uniref:DEAD/DEAH box helicase domain protein n=1 Tax=Polaromonas naphthalenivorans (strain CJ2) TaxID=365044 RepID=A1VV81_POLNA|nr:DEAD/DEAH box helicase [Polaromonas naphthalenivorans]ABM39559.1 DEAD/DEAH box helicase domain protein [Polaromonas naphthalenivorans CJ2]